MNTKTNKLTKNTSTNKKAVIGTASDAITSKLSCVKNNYIDDEFISFFVPKYVRRSPVINRGYYTRIQTIQQILISFHNIYPERDKQIISLGCGYDTTYFYLKQKNIQFKNYIEIDFNNVCIPKSKIIQNEIKLNNSLTNPLFCTKIIGNIYSDDYQLLSADLSKIKTLEESFNIAKIDYSLPTLFLSECVLIYMDTNDSDNLIKWANDKFYNGSIFVTYEQILPYDCFGQTMIKNLKKRFIYLNSYESYPDLYSQEKRYRSFGYKCVKSLDLNNIYQKYISDKEKKRIEKLEIFDEFEEFHLMLAHYCVVIAVDYNENTRELINVGFINISN